MDNDAALRVEVAAADRMVWEGEAASVVARTSEGDIGILPNHEPLLGVLVPNAIEIVAADGRREVIAVDGGFLSVDDNKVRIISQFARLAREVSVEQAQRNYDTAYEKREAGDNSEETTRAYQRARAQLRAAEKARALEP